MCSGLVLCSNCFCAVGILLFLSHLDNFVNTFSCHFLCSYSSTRRLPQRWVSVSHGWPVHSQPLALWWWHRLYGPERWEQLWGCHPHVWPCSQIQLQRFWWGSGLEESWTCLLNIIVVVRKLHVDFWHCFHGQDFDRYEYVLISILKQQKQS